MSQMSDKKDDEFRIELKTSGAKNISYSFFFSGFTNEMSRKGKRLVRPSNQETNLPLNSLPIIKCRDALINKAKTDSANCSIAGTITDLHSKPLRWSNLKIFLRRRAQFVSHNKKAAWFV